MNYLTNYSGEAATQFIMDRDRTVVYNGLEVIMNTYKCSDCKAEYYLETEKHNHCPYCGSEYKFQFDASA